MRQQCAAIAPAWRNRGCWLCSHPGWARLCGVGRRPPASQLLLLLVPPQQLFSLPWPGPLLASCRKDTVRGGVQILGALSSFFFLVDWPLPSPCLCPPTPIPFSLCSQNYKQESQCSCRSCPSRKSVEKRLGAMVLRGAKLMTELPGSSSQSMLSKLASARSRAMPPDGS